jgi:hypothetical protein
MIVRTLSNQKVLDKNVTCLSIFLPIAGLTGSYQGITSSKSIAFERTFGYTPVSFENTFAK